MRGFIGACSMCSTIICQPIMFISNTNRLINQNVKLTCQRLTHVPSNFLRAVLAASEACVARVASADAFGG